MKNHKIEQCWIDIWDDLYDLNAQGTIFVDGSSYQRLCLEDAQGFVQDTVYSGYDVVLKEGWHKGSKAVLLIKGESLDSHG
ncbi:MAG: hypothetical protein COA78_30635 [Blastopirellula sp.]|nr:MAG: hypothetical protein COA78_30635 [Blastopirellula sp.]